MRYGIQSIPTIVLFKDGEPAAAAVGAMPKGDARARLGLPKRAAKTRPPRGLSAGRAGTPGLFLPRVLVLLGARGSSGKRVLREEVLDLRDPRAAQSSSQRLAEVVLDAMKAAFFTHGHDRHEPGRPQWADRPNLTLGRGL